VHFSTIAPKIDSHCIHKIDISITEKESH